MDKHSNQRNKGSGYEILARRYLEQAGLLFHSANVVLRGGEIDIVMRDGGIWVFVEVRFRNDAAFGGAAASITYTKQRRLCHTAAVWLAGHGASFDTSPCRFDVIAITGNQIEWFPNAFNTKLTPGRKFYRKPNQ